MLIAIHDEDFRIPSVTTMKLIPLKLADRNLQGIHFEILVVKYHVLGIRLYL